MARYLCTGSDGLDHVIVCSELARNVGTLAECLGSNGERVNPHPDGFVSLDGRVIYTLVREL